MWSVRDLMERDGHFFASAGGVPATTLAHWHTVEQLLQGNDVQQGAMMALGGSFGVSRGSKAHINVLPECGMHTTLLNMY